MGIQAIHRFRNSGVFGAVAALLLALGAQGALNHYIRAQDTVFVAPSDEYRRQWNPVVFKALTFGHLPIAIDWHWIQALIDPSLAKLPKGIHPPLYYIVDFITELDPAFFEAYYVGANLLSVIRDDGEGARDLLIKARRFRDRELPAFPREFKEKHWEGSWFLSVMLGYVQLFDLNDMPAAAVAFQEAATQPGAPAYVKRLATRLQEPGGHYEVGLRLLNFLISSATDPRLKEGYERQRFSLFVSQYIADLNRSFRLHLERDPMYRAAHGLSRREMERWWQGFQREQRVPAQDPWGGRITLNESGRIVTSTPHSKVFGLE